METLLKLLPAPGQPRAVRYGATVALVGAFFLFSLSAQVATGPFEFLILVLPVLLASVLYDRGSGFLATGLGVLAIASQLDWQSDIARHLVALAVFAFVALFIAVFCEALRTALERGAAAQQELQLLLQEQRHRTKNDLALLSSMLRLQARSQSNPPVRAALESAVAKLHVIAEGQDHFQASEHATNMQEYLEDVCWRLGEALRDIRPIALRVDSEEVMLDSRQAIRIGLIVNELVTNALRHAFPGDRAGTVQVRLRQRAGDLSIIVEDDGVGYPADVRVGLGSRLMLLLAGQSGGSIRRELANPGCRLIVTIPLGIPASGDPATSWAA